MENKIAGRNRRHLIMVRLNGAEKAALESLVEQFDAQFPGGTWTQSDVMRNALAELHLSVFHVNIPPLKKGAAGHAPKNLLAAALSSNRVVFSVMGPHAGESADAIFLRKCADIDAAGSTFWLHRSSTARPDKANAFFAGEDDRFVIFLAALRDNGARPTTTSTTARLFSSDNKTWNALPETIGPVTGKLPAFAFSFAQLDLCEELIDLGKYATDGGPVRFRLGASTVLAEKIVPAPAPTEQFRRAIAVGRLASPGVVWVR